jgi:hypothetical protein
VFDRELSLLRIDGEDLPLKRILLAAITAVRREEKGRESENSTRETKSVD